MRTLILGAAIVLVISACGSDRGTAATGPDPSLTPSTASTSTSTTVAPAPGDNTGGGPEGVEGVERRVGCLSHSFFPESALDTAPPLIEDSSVPAVADAIAPFLESEEGQMSWPQEGWRVLEATEGERVLLVNPGSDQRPLLAFMRLEWTDDEWRWAGSSIPGDCDLVVEPPADGTTVVDWRLDPTADPLTPESTTVVLEATERACAGGQAMGDRLNQPEVTYTDDAVLIRLSAQPSTRSECPGNPSQRVEIELAEPLGDREVSDAHATDLGPLDEILRALIGAS